jgi:propionyl-CoA carboxylase alpha chain
VIGVDFDPMIAKVIATAPTRADAAGRLALGLENLHLDGVTTNRDFLAAVLRSEPFLAGDTTTDFIERVAPPVRRRLDVATIERLAVAAAMWLQGHHHSQAVVMGSIPSGFVVGRIPPERVTLAPADGAGDRDSGEAGEDGDAAPITVHYRRHRDGSFRLGPAGQDGSAVVHRWAPDELDVEIDRRRTVLRVSLAQRATGERRIQLTGAGGGIGFDVVPRFSVPKAELPGGSVAAPMPGKVLEVRVERGQRVSAGQVVAVLEAMKMENHLAVAEDGVVAEIRVAVGDQVEKDVLLLVIEPDSADNVTPGVQSP